jgi:hypothetical protein
MIPMKRVGLLAGAATLTLAGGSFADTDLEAQNQELRARIADLESRLEAVESQNGADWLTEQRAEEIKGLVQDVLADADTRSSLLSQGMTAGYDNGAVISSADGNWLLRTNIFLQTRFMLTNANKTEPGFDGAPDQNTIWGFEVTRAKFILTGNVVNPDWFYKIQFDIGSNQFSLIDPNTGDFVGRGGTGGLGVVGLQEGYIGYDYGNGWRVMLGAMKAPFMREELVDPWNQLAAERSLYNYVFTAGYTAGIAVDWTGDQFRFCGMYHNGVQNLIYVNGDPTGGVYGGSGPAALPDTDVAFSVRGEWLAMGTWDQFNDMTSAQGEEQGLLVGVAIDYQQPQVPATADSLLVAITGDVSWEMGGANLFASVNWGKGDNSGGIADVSPWGIMVQGGYYFTEDWEGFVRYEYANIDQTIDYGDINIMTLGVNKYFMGNHAKWVTDFGFAFDSVPISSPITGWRADPTGGKSQFVMRTQLSILF